MKDGGLCSLIGRTSARHAEGRGFKSPCREGRNFSQGKLSRVNPLVMM